jgi:hypothetical protein
MNVAQDLYSLEVRHTQRLMDIPHFGKECVMEKMTLCGYLWLAREGFSEEVIFLPGSDMYNGTTCKYSGWRNSGKRKRKFPMARRLFCGHCHWGWSWEGRSTERQKGQPMKQRPLGKGPSLELGGVDIYPLPTEPELSAQVLTTRSRLALLQPLPPTEPQPLPPLLQEPKKPPAAALPLPSKLAISVSAGQSLVPSHVCT